MWSDRFRILLTAVIVVLLAGATVAVFAVDTQSDQVRSQAIDGRNVFLTKGCTSCHSLEGVSTTGQIGPNLTGLADRAGDRVEGMEADDYIRQSVLDPEAFVVDGFSPLMPVLPLDTEELDALVEFLLAET
ncbi:MAG TPA: c-type cytochrome [Acidimicrobiia bacterium]|nr:c-type cytochrome [Acidimicrobiia bacterium]